jgi:sorbitol/mannitol transport system substrate-binding protein
MRKTLAFIATAAVASLVVTACSSSTGTGETGGGTTSPAATAPAPPATTTSAPAGGGETTTAASGATINVLMVGNPQMNDLQSLTDANFTAKTGIKVNFTILPENELRDKVQQDIANQAGQYDVATIGAYETTVWEANDWLTDLQPYADKDTAFDVKDIMPAMKGLLSDSKGDLMAAPFYGESAFLMYRSDIFQKDNITMPAAPTWNDVLDIAKKLKTAEPDMAPICLRGLPGWGENMAVVGSMISGFGGGFFDKDYNSLLLSDGTKNAVNFYMDLVKNYGEAGAPQSGFTECLNTFSQGKAAMWFDATSAATTLESSASTVAGKVGYAPAPKDKLNSGWLWAWAWAIPKTTKQADAAWQFVSWASSKEYENLALQQLGRLPDGKRLSTFDIAAYQQSAKAYIAPMKAAIEASDPTNCQAQPSPGPGCQYLGIPEFADLGTKIGQEMSAALSGNETVDQALQNSDGFAQQTAKDIKG